MGDTSVFLSPNFLPLFIDAYRNHHCLWRIKCKEYSNKNLKQIAYLDLVDLCKSVIPDCNVEYVKKKIDLIRGNFRREHKKVNDSLKSGTGADSVHVPKLWYYKLLLFLSDQEEVRPSISSIDSSIVDPDSEHIDENSEQQEYEDVEDSNAPETPQQNETTPNSFGRRKRAKQNENLTTSYLQQAVTILQQQDDEHDKFAANVAAKLRKMDARQSMFAENIINQVLFQGLLGKLEEESTIQHPQTLVATPYTRTSVGSSGASSGTVYRLSPNKLEDSSSNYSLLQL